jgi:hypothetical protein
MCPNKVPKQQSSRFWGLSFVYSIGAVMLQTVSTRVVVDFPLETRVRFRVRGYGLGLGLGLGLRLGLGLGLVRRGDTSLVCEGEGHFRRHHRIAGRAVGSKQKKTSRANPKEHIKNQPGRRATYGCLRTFHSDPGPYPNPNLI